MSEDTKHGGVGPFKFVVLAILLGWYLLLLPLFWLDARHWRRRRRNNRPNKQGNNLLGRKAVLTDVTEAGVGSLLIDDVWWVASCAENAAIGDGTEVDIVRVTGATLTVRPV